MDQLKEVDLDNEYKTQTAHKIYQILSLFDPGPDITYLPVRQMLLKIFDVAKQCQCLRKKDLLSVLIGHAGNKLVEEFCRIDYESEINNAVATYQSHAELTEEQRCLLHLSSLEETNTRWKMFFLLTMKKQRHLLGVVMVCNIINFKCQSQLLQVTYFVIFGEIMFNVLSEQSASINCCLFVTVHIKFNSEDQVAKVKLFYVINTFCLFSQKMFERKA